MMAMDDEIMFEAMEGLILYKENETTTKTDYNAIHGVEYYFSYDAMDGIEYEGNNDMNGVEYDEEDLKMDKDEVMLDPMLVEYYDDSPENLEDEMMMDKDEVMLDPMLVEYYDDSPDNLEDEMMAAEVQLWY
jgi:hypothetical protein